MNILFLSLLIIGGYFIGSLPIGYWFAKLHGVNDITRQGSGNIGATNVARVLGKKYFFLIFFLDFLKAFIYLKMFDSFLVAEKVKVITAIALLIGNGYSVFLKGLGGKGVATSLGIMSAFIPRAFVSCILCWGSALLMTNTIGMASCAMLASLPFISFTFRSDGVFIMLTVFMSFWGLFRHRSNLVRYFNIKV